MNDFQLEDQAQPPNSRQSPRIATHTPLLEDVLVCGEDAVDVLAARAVKAATLLELAPGTAGTLAAGCVDGGAIGGINAGLAFAAVVLAAVRLGAVGHEEGVATVVLGGKLTRMLFFTTGLLAVSTNSTWPLNKSAATVWLPMAGTVPMLVICTWLAPVTDHDTLVLSPALTVYLLAVKKPIATTGVGEEEVAKARLVAAG
ncbi:hypothetical protein ACFQT0_17845 [Hymenobacter humi]|uniref:Uncharacterized protein n=1 Tax=Hymenobacter humi TaxID=1411620 RepID=A0ABW2U946_9BACT